MKSIILIALLSSLIAVAILMRRRKARGRTDRVVYQGAIKAIRDGHYPALERFVPYLPRSRRPKFTVAAGPEDTIPMMAPEPPGADHPDALNEGGSSHD